MARVNKENIFDPTFYNKRVLEIGDELEGSVDKLINRLQELTKNTVNARLVIDRNYWEGPDSITLEWYEPMTEEEVKKKKAKLAADKEARKTRTARQKLVQAAKKAETPEAAVELLKTDPALLQSIISNLR